MVAVGEAVKPSEEQLAARRQLAEAREALRARKRDARRKIVAGAVALAHVGHDGDFRRDFCRRLQMHVTRPHDRALFPDLLQDG